MCSSPTMLEMRSSTLSLTPPPSLSSIPLGSFASLPLLLLLTASSIAFSTAICCFRAASPALPPRLPPAVPSTMALLSAISSSFGSIPAE